MRLPHSNRYKRIKAWGYVDCSPETTWYHRERRTKAQACRHLVAHMKKSKADDPSFFVRYCLKVTGFDDVSTNPKAELMAYIGQPPQSSGDNFSLSS